MFRPSTPMAINTETEKVKDDGTEGAAAEATGFVDPEGRRRTGSGR